MIVGVPKETFPGERRVALFPGVAQQLVKIGHSVLLEFGAGEAAGFLDAAYQENGAQIAPNRAEVFTAADVIVQVRAPGANPEAGKSDIELLRNGQFLIGFCEPFTAGDETRAVAARGAALLSMELMPRITRAQSMDALSSMATIAGYKAVLLAADALPRMFPMLMTAAGTIAPARVLVIGAGVAGLQAIATARRLGAVVSGYDVRTAVKEQVESLGAKFVVLDLETGAAEGKGGYAKAMDEAFYRRQRELMTQVVREQDVVITTAAVPGKRAPILITREMVQAMSPGSVVIDIAAERGGNCEITKPGETVVERGVSVLGPLNLPSAIPYHASQLYARNVLTFIKHLTKEGRINLDLKDEITRDTLVTHGGEVVNPRVREAIGLPALPSETGTPAVAAAS